MKFDSTVAHSGDHCNSKVAFTSGQHVARQDVAGSMLFVAVNSIKLNCYQFLARLLLDLGIHVAEIQATCCRQQETCCHQRAT